MVPRLTQDEFEQSIADTFDEWRNELHVEQVAPVYDRQRSVFIRVRPELVLQAREVHESLPEKVAEYLQLSTGSELRWTGAPLEAEALYLDLRQPGDRIYAGYHNIYRGLKALAPYLEDARFFITEMYDTFVDEYRIVSGALWFSRGTIDEDSDEEIARHWEKRVEASPEDHELRRFLARQQVYEGEFYARRAGGSPPGDAERKDDVERAAVAFVGAIKHSPENARAWKQKGALHQILGEHDQAAECLERALSLGAGPEVLQSLALVVFSARRDAEALTLLRRLPAEPSTRVANQLAGHLLSRTGEAKAAAEAFATAQRLALNPPGKGELNPDAEELFRTGRADEVLATYFDHVAARVTSDPNSTARDVIVRDLVDWGRFFWSRMDRGFSPDRMGQLSHDFYDRAIALGDPQGAAHHWKGYSLKKRGELAQAVRLFEQALEINPQHLDALTELGRLALEMGDREKAIAYLRSYAELSGRAGTGSYYRQHYGALLMKALYDKANHLIDVVRDPVAAEAVFDEIIALGPLLPAGLRNFEGAWVGKSNARAWRGEHAAALEFADRALQLNPQSGYAWSARGSALNNLRRFAEALPCYERAIAAEPAYWHPYHCKACTLALTGGDREEIYALIRKAVSLSPERRAMLREEPDFASLRGDPGFLALFSES
jgi:tetratricopeptide (TPR) repeat protein